MSLNLLYLKLIRLKEKRASQEDASCSSSEESGYEEVDIPSEFRISKYFEVLFFFKIYVEYRIFAMQRKCFHV
jgi:hypothetical protein